MKNLQELALIATEKNIVKVTKSKNVCDSLFEILFEKNQKFEKTQLISQITIERLSEKYDEKTLVDLFTKNDVEFLKEFKSVNQTVKNSFEAAICQGSTSASFCSNEKYSKYEIIKENKLFSIKLK